MAIFNGQDLQVGSAVAHEWDKARAVATAAVYHQTNSTSP